MRRRRLFRWAAALLAALVLAGAAVAVGTATWLGRQIRRRLPPDASVGSIRYAWPIGVALRDLKLADPAGQEPFLLGAEEVTLQVPVWGLAMRPIPAEVRLKSPHLRLHSENVLLLMDVVRIPTQGWIRLPGVLTEGEGGSSPGVWQGMASLPFPFVPTGLKVSGARMDVIEELLREGQPLFIVSGLNAEVGAALFSGSPSIRLTGAGDFVTPEGLPIGELSFDVRAGLLGGGMEGSLRLRHERLGDFRRVYEYAPRPVFIEAGKADVHLQAALSEGRRLRVSARCQVEDLRLEGIGGGVPWPAVVSAVEDEQGRYVGEATVEGRLDDPAFDVHDRILSELEWGIKERAASRGLRIPGELFFYADTPSEEDDIMEVPP